MATSKNKHWDDAVKRAGKYGSQLEKVGKEIGKSKSEKGRAQAAAKTIANNILELVKDGASAEVLAAAIHQLYDNGPVLYAAVKRGAGSEPTYDDFAAFKAAASIVP